MFSLANLQSTNRFQVCPAEQIAATIKISDSKVYFRLLSYSSGSGCEVCETLVCSNEPYSVISNQYSVHFTEH